MPASTFGRAVSMAAVADHNNHDLPKPIRRRRPPFFLWVDPRASAVRSSATAGRERAPVTRATHLPLPAAKNGNMRRRWFEGGRDHTLSAVAWASRGPRRVEDGGAWTGVQEPQKRVDWCAPCSFCTKLRHEQATMAHPQWHKSRGWSGRWTTGMRGDDFVGVVGFLWMNVMSVECENACFKVEHDLFCTNQPLLSRVCCTVPGSLDYG